MDRFIHPDARILVCDGRKALILRNEGPAGSPQLTVEREIHASSPSGHDRDLGTDRPGRSAQRQGAQIGPRSAMEEVDFHAAEEEKFVRETLHDFTAHCEQHKVREIVLIAPPRALAVLRKAASKAFSERVVGEIDKDLTRHPVADIARALSA
jgi:protein required for attachment to host cells